MCVAMRNELWIFVTKFFNGSNGAGNYSAMLNNNAFFMTVLIYDDNHCDSRPLALQYSSVAIIFASIYQRVSHASDCSSECHCTRCIKTSIRDFNARLYHQSPHLLLETLEWYSCLKHSVLKKGRKVAFL